MSDTNQLLETLIQSNQSLNENVGQLTQSVNSLVAIDAARAEREKNQEEKNERYEAFIEENTEPLSRLRRFQGHWDKAADKVFTLIVIAVMAAAGFNFLS